MEAITIEYTYGEALYEVADETDKIKQIKDEISAIDNLLTENEDFFELLKTPVISAEEKKEIAEKVFSGSISDIVLNFIFILVDKRRIDRFPGITKAYNKIVDESTGFEIGYVYSVVDISEEKLGKLEEETGKLLHKNVKLENKIDKSLIGGMKIYVDGKLIDASIKTKLNELKEKIS